MLGILYIYISCIERERYFSLFFYRIKNLNVKCIPPNPGVFQYRRPVNNHVYMSYTDTNIHTPYNHVNSRNIYYKARCQEDVNESY